MSDPLLHIKDSFYFEIPKILWQRNFQSARDFPEVWVRLDADFQRWEADRLYERLVSLVREANSRRQAAGLAEVVMPDPESLLHDYEHWKHEDHVHHGVPLPGFLELDLGRADQLYREWKSRDPGRVDQSFDAFWSDAAPELNQGWFVVLHRDAQFAQGWQVARREANNVAEYKATEPQWSAEKIAAYNRHLSGKVLIPQPFGTLRNLYERESGFAVSRFMILEVVVALLLLFIFSWLARRMVKGGPPQGKRWNLLEVFLVFIRDQIARPAIGKHDADKFVPLLWTLFMFILFCNLFGLIPWLGAPTGGWGVPFGLALITFGTGVLFGMRQFGVFGFFLNQIPHMDLPLVFAIIIKPILLAIELLGFLIKHAVLSIRLLANMVAGHLVLLGVMGMAFGPEAAVNFADAPNWQWGVTAVIAVLGSTLFSVLELFVAFLQAYIFTFLSALFIGAAIHHH